MKEEFEKRIEEISLRAFVKQYVYGSLPELRDSTISESEFEVRKVQNDGTGPATVRYSLRGSPALFGKLYRDDSGAHAEQVLRNLRKAEFGNGQRYQVAEPLLFMPERNLLLTRAVRGECLDSYLGKEEVSAALIGVREAAKWLARLHDSSVRVGSLDGPWYMFNKLSMRFAKAAASHPQQLKKLTTMLAQMERFAERLDTAGRVQTHGQYRPVHVFLTDDAVTLVDLDRGCPSDPAKDLAEFIHRLRTTVFTRSSRMDHANLLTNAFLEEYSSLRKTGVQNLAFYRCFHVLASMCRQIKSMKPDDPELNRTIRFYSAELEDAMTGFQGKTGSPNRTGRPKTQFNESLDVRTKYVTRPEFIEQAVYPALDNNGIARPCSPVDCEVDIVQNRGTGRVTMKYLFEDGRLLYGKLYSDEMAQHSYRVLKELWHGGFGQANEFQVSQPLLYLPQYGFLLLSAVKGTPLSSLIGSCNGSDIVLYARRAARWLVGLHTSQVREGRAESEWHSFKAFKVIRRLAKATAYFPAERKMLTKFIDALCKTGKQTSGMGRLVQTHGRFHYEHILFNGSTTTVIDFDRSFPSNPAKDLAEFLSMLRRRTFKLTGSTAEADAPTRAFVTEYSAHLPENANALPVHWGAFLLLTLFRDVRKHAAKPESLERVMRFYREEFEAVLSGRLVTDEAIIAT